MIDRQVLKLLREAAVLKTAGQWDLASARLHDVLALRPDLAAAWNNLGAVYFAQGKWAAAISAYQTAIDLRPQYLEAIYNLALAYTKSGQHEQGRHTYQLLLELAPQHAGARFQLACLFMAEQNYAIALTHFSLLVRDFPEQAEVQVNLATCYLKLGQLSAAKTHYQHALTLLPQDTQLLFNLGVISMHQGRVREAIDYYTQAISIHADFYEAHNNLSVAYLALQDRHNALRHFREVLRILPHDAAVQHTIDILAQDKKLTASPPAYIRALFNSYADHYDAHLTQALHYQVPEALLRMVTKVRPLPQQEWDILDVGCGTGLCGELFKSAARSLVGVDLAENMLELAARKNIYSQLIPLDMLDFLTEQQSSFDLIMAGDVLVYSGDLAMAFAAVQRALRRGGLFVFNTEWGMTENYVLTSAGRFAHSQAYIEQLARHEQLTILASETMVLRQQNTIEVRGGLYLLQK